MTADIMKAGATKIMLANVVAVNEENYTCTISTIGVTSALIHDVAYATPYSSPYGAGIDFVPEVNSLCVVVTNLSTPMSADDQKAKILAFYHARDDLGKFGGAYQERISMRQGDVVMSAPLYNRLELLTEGNLRLLADDACSLEMIRDSSTINALCGNFNLITNSGHIRWNADNTEEGQGPSRLNLTYKSKADIEVGGSNLFTLDLNPAGLEMQVFDPEQSNTQSGSNFLLGVDTDGYVRLNNKSSIFIDCLETINANAGTGLTLQTPTVYVSTGDSSIELTGDLLRIDVSEVQITSDKVTIDTRTGENASLFKVEKEETPDTLNKQLVTEDVLNWLFNHVHPSNGSPALGAPTNSDEMGESTSFESISAGEAASRIEASLINAGLLTALTTFSGSLAATPGTPPPTAQTLHAGLTVLTAALIADLSTAGSEANSSLADSGVVMSYKDVLSQSTKVR